ncbi:HPr kinase/phosphorylase [Ruegeria sp.]|uniref:HPr kinase/phosphorylase n=1 Tax=Ruegeria sp. TaxID=1879320 RepID=UPI003C7C9A42
MECQSLKDTVGREAACVHASCVAVLRQGVLIVGPSGAGKSGLALHMMALGAQLVGDDRIDLAEDAGRVIADAPPAIRGLVEARGIGLLRADTAGPVPVSVVVDLGQETSKRLPDPMTVPVLRQTVPLLHAAGIPNLAAALMQYVKMGRVDPEWPNR